MSLVSATGAFNSRMEKEYEVIFLVPRGFTADFAVSLAPAFAGQVPNLASTPLLDSSLSVEKFVASVDYPIDVSLFRALLAKSTLPLAAWALRAKKASPSKLFVFDTDSTFIEEEVIDELADFAGFKDQVASITERAMKGTLDFDTALAERVHLLRGLSVTTLESVLQTKLHLTKGAQELIASAATRGVLTYLVSGGFTFFTRHFAEKLSMTGHFANELEVVDGMLTGKTLGPIVNRQRKAKILKELAEKHGIPLEQCVAIGDGANDLDMLQISGLGIAFCAKPALSSTATAGIIERDLRLVAELVF